MIVPSIDLAGGSCVQLVGGERQKLDAGDPRPWLERFRRVGEVALIDLDAARGTGSNTALVEELCARGPCRVGGGIRDVETAKHFLNAGATRVIVGTAASPELLRELPRERVQVALDARDGEVVVEGWRRGTGRGILERVDELREYAGSFLVTFVELEGRLGGTDLARAEEIVHAAGDARVTIAGGVTELSEIVALDRIGADAQVGMAIYEGRMGLADAFAAPLVSDRPDGLWPTVVVDESGRALGLAYSSLASLREALDTGRGVYQSRKRGLWVKGASSGATQELVSAHVDCDRDTLRFTVRQREPGFCHAPSTTCWGEDGGLARLEHTLRERARTAPEGSYSASLFADAEHLGAKLREEAEELATASSEDEVIWEAADVLYFTLVRMRAAGIDLADVERELDRRANLIERHADKSRGGAR